MPYSKEEIAKGFKAASEGDDGGFFSDPMVKAVKGLIGGNDAGASSDDVQKKIIKERMKKIKADD